MPGPPKRNRKKIRKSETKRGPIRFIDLLNAQVGGEKILAPRNIPNVHNERVMHKLMDFKHLDQKLAVDSFAQNLQRSVPLLRCELYQMYSSTSQMRRYNKATKSQITNAKIALSHLTRALESLAKVSLEGHDGYRLAWERPDKNDGEETGPRLDDKKGEREINELAAESWESWGHVVYAGLGIEAAIDGEKRKLSNAGERPKRLRSLVEALADWWQSAGRSLAPIVDANRRDNGPAVVHGRHGDFLDLALALFCKVDVFKETEVVAAVTNVHEKRLAAISSGRKN